MTNLILSIVVAYYLIKTGDLFKLLRKGSKFVGDFLASLKQEASSNKLSSDPIDVLKLRYAKGEINQQDYEQMKASI